jgi:hypothetical protein
MIIYYNLLIKDRVDRVDRVDGSSISISRIDG